ncbi:hypothetical protein FB451DRAFT_1190288 [Mycena latifolia]|nr:hypothetical protein FB451DRAFT_1190288 [Mycena latifolia]
MLLRGSAGGSSGSGARGKSSIAGALSSSSKKILSNFSAANRESNLGMQLRNEPDGESSAPTSRKGKGKKKDKRSSDIFKVSLIFIISQGTEFVNGVLRIAEGHDVVPNRVDTQTAVLEGRAVLSLSEGFEIDRNWTHEEVVEAFAKLLPLPFSYFDQKQDEADDDEPAWRLATVVGKKIVISPVIRPNGSNLDYNKGNVTTGFKNSRLFIVSRQQIPTELLREWASPELKSFRNEQNINSDSDNESDAGAPENQHNSPSPERIPRPNKRRLFSKSSSDDEDFVATKKGKGPSGRTWLRGPASNTTGGNKAKVIDLTTEAASAASAVDGALPPKAGVTVDQARAPSEESEVFEDPSIGDPYDKNYVFEF